MSKANAQAKAILLDEVFARADLSPTAKAVFFVLIQHLDLNTLQCNPGKARLAAKLGMSVDTIKRGLREQLKAGVITRKPTKRSPLYSFPQLKGGQPCPPSQDQGGANLHPSSGGRSAPSSGGNPAPRTYEPIEPSNGQSGKENGSEGETPPIAVGGEKLSPEQEEALKRLKQISSETASAMKAKTASVLRKPRRWHA